jgi:serine protease Do
VRPEDKELAQLLEQFVPVRVTDFKNVDLNRFRFDYDLTFAVLMMDAEGGTYSRFGSQDWRSSSERMSIAGLKTAMRQVLARHRRDRARRIAAAPRETRATLADIPAFRKSPAAREACAHCHYAHNFRFEQLRAEDRFSREMLFMFPLPENLGLTLDVDDNNRVRSVASNSPAARAGLRPGDRITRANETSVLTEADLQFAMNPLPDPGSVTLHWQRGQERQRSAVLRLPRGWRRTDISWRASQAGIPPTVGIWAEPLTKDQKEQRGLRADRLALRVSFLFPGEQWAKTRGELKLDDVIVGIDGRSLPAMTTRQFHSHFRLAFDVGDTATLNVLRGSERLEVRVPCVDVGDD